MREKDMSAETKDQSLHWIERMSLNLSVMEPFAIEVMMVVSSLWGAYKLVFHKIDTRLLDIVENINHTEPFHVLRQMGLDPNSFGWFFLSGGMLMSIGMVLDVGFKTGWWGQFGLGMRCLGLCMSAVCWSLLGFTFTYGNAASLASVPLVMMGLSGFWALLRYPAMPRGH